jgi:hypothetical protein
MNESKKAFIIILTSVLVFAGGLFLWKQIIGKENIFKKESWMNIFSPKNDSKNNNGNNEGGKKEASSLPPQMVNIPKVIFNSSGIIKEIKKDGVVVNGSGSNFPDQKQREITIRYLSGTITNNRNRTQRWVGFDGLQQLRISEKIIFESSQNIREKTDFNVSYVSQL